MVPDPAPTPDPTPFFRDLKNAKKAAPTPFFSDLKNAKKNYFFLITYLQVPVPRTLSSVLKT